VEFIGQSRREGARSDVRLGLPPLPSTGKVRAVISWLNSNLGERVLLARLRLKVRWVLFRDDMFKPANQKREFDLKGTSQIK
jgi:hypothetical protein